MILANYLYCLSGMKKLKSCQITFASPKKVIDNAGCGLRFFYMSESFAWKSSWESLKRENDRLRTNGSPNVAISTRYNAILTLPPESRRAWFEGEFHLFEQRVSSVQNKFRQPFLTASDIPWPVAPTVPVSTPITSVMINSFLLSGLLADESEVYCQDLSVKFQEDKVVQWTNEYVLERERGRVRMRASEVVQCLQELIHATGRTSA